jgi:hypothetical protein
VELPLFDEGLLSMDGSIGGLFLLVKEYFAEYFAAFLSNVLTRKDRRRTNGSRSLGVSFGTEMPDFWRPFADLIRVMPA